MFVSIVFRFVLGSRRIAERYDCAFTDGGEARRQKTNPGPRAAFHLSRSSLVSLMIRILGEEEEVVVVVGDNELAAAKPRLECGARDFGYSRVQRLGYASARDSSRARLSPLGQDRSLMTNLKVALSCTAKTSSLLKCEPHQRPEERERRLISSRRPETGFCRFAVFAIYKLVKRRDKSHCCCCRAANQSRSANSSFSCLFLQRLAHQTTSAPPLVPLSPRQHLSR